MPRTIRKTGSTGYTHVITRGIGRQVLFESASDYRKYLLLLQRCCIETGVKICAFCLMENHVHLLTYSDKDSLINLMRRIGVNYAGYFNVKYERSGHVFQNRYKSEPIEDERYLLTVFRYILLNPQKAGICKANEYTWSSYGLYDKKLDFMDLDRLRILIGDNHDYMKFIQAENDDECLEWDRDVSKDNRDIKRIKKLLDIDNCLDIQKYEQQERNRAIRLLRKNGLSIRQIERLTGISRGIIQRV